MTYKAISDIGCVRKNNEDMAYVDSRFIRDGAIKGIADFSKEVIAFAIADGMGGYEGGEVASEIVCRSFHAFIDKLKTTDTPQLLAELKKWAIDANRLVNESAALRPELSEMGTTFVALLFARKKMWLINIGDSRCYRMRGGILKQLSTDHSEINRTGNSDTPSNLIYNYMGNRPEDFFSDVTEYIPLAGDTYLLCSDGLSDMMADEEIEKNANAVEQLVNLAKEAGGNDNISIISIKS